MISTYFKRLGILRTLLAALFVALIVMAPFAGDNIEYSDWRIIPSLVAPALVPILLFVVLFDSVMGRAIMSDDERKERYGTILWTHVGLVVGVVFAWELFFSKLF